MLTFAVASIETLAGWALGGWAGGLVGAVANQILNAAFGIVG